MNSVANVCHAMDYCPVIKTNKVVINATTWMNLETYKVKASHKGLHIV